ncbi:MAG: hypothetical protein VB101_10570 [Rhodospirillaceae bacterium]|nr:hypothetical protein [Rhodospirillaceae bacterium]
MNSIIHIRDVMRSPRRATRISPFIKAAATRQNTPRMALQWSVCPDTNRLTTRWHADSPARPDEGDTVEPGALRRNGTFPRNLPARRVRYG